MYLDVQSHLNAIDRSVSFIDRDGQPAAAGHPLTRISTPRS